MTCIVGYEHKGSIYIGGDSAISNDNLISTLSTSEKVFILEDMIFGFCGSMRVAQVIKYCLNLPLRKEDCKNDMVYLVKDVIDAVRKILKDKATMSVDDHVETVPDSSFLLGYNKKLYVVDTDMQVSRCDDGYAAVGSGDGLALGALFATKHLDMPPEDRLKLSLEAATHHSIHVRPKFHIMKLPNKRKIAQ